MKKLMIVALGLAFALGTISFASPNYDDKKTDAQKKNPRDGAPKMVKQDDKKTDAPKKGKKKKSTTM
jgi:hypothetical protein